MTDTAVAAPAAASTASHSSARRLSFARLVRSETIKLATLRSPWWSIVVVAALSIGMSLLIAWAFSTLATDATAAGPGGPPIDAGMNIPLQAIVTPVSFTVLLATIIGSIQVTGEYSTGMIRSSLTAAPGRLGTLFAKALVIAVFVFVASLVIFALAAVATAPVLGAADMHLDLGDPEASYLPILAAAFELAVIAILGLSAGYILRNGPGAIALGVGLVFVLPLVPAFFPAGESWAWIHDVARFLPTNAGQSLITPGMESGLDALPALLTLLAWAAAGLLGAAAVLKTRDA